MRERERRSLAVAMIAVGIFQAQVAATTDVAPLLAWVAALGMVGPGVVIARWPHATVALGSLLLVWIVASAARLWITDPSWQTAAFTAFAYLFMVWSFKLLPGGLNPTRPRRGATKSDEDDSNDTTEGES